MEVQKLLNWLYSSVCDKVLKNISIYERGTISESDDINSSVQI